MIRSVLSWLEKSEQRAPDAVWLQDLQVQLTYREAVARAKVAGTCIARRAPMGAPVLILADKAPETVIMMLGAVYAGCFYTPADASMPQARLTLISDRLNPALVMYHSKYAKAAESLGLPSLCFDEVGGDCDEPLLMERRALQIDTDLLYVLFTSGSTGVPKGVAITHRSVIDFISWAVQALKLSDSAAFGSQAPLYFDNSVLDLYGSMAAGGRVCFLPRAHFAFPGRLIDDLVSMRVNTLFWVPSALTAIAASDVSERLADTALRNIFFCG